MLHQPIPTRLEDPLLTQVHAQRTGSDLLRLVIRLLDHESLADFDPAQMARAESALGCLLNEADDAEADGFGPGYDLPGIPVITTTVRELDPAAWAFGKLGGSL